MTADRHERSGIVSPDRRHLLQLMASTLALAGLSACGDPPEEIVPAVMGVPPEERPGESQFYATAVTLGGYATGVLVRHVYGRPVKVEGNPDHPDSLGATDAFTQAAILDLYDPDRAKGITDKGRLRAWQDLAREILENAAMLRRDGGERLRLLMEPTSSPTLRAQLAQFRQAFPQAGLHVWEAAGRGNVLEGARLAFGRPLEPVPDLSQARAVLAIESDLFSDAPGHLRHAHDFMRDRSERRNREAKRLYAIESTPTLTGTAADHRFALAPDETATALFALAGLVGVMPPAKSSAGFPWLEPMARDLRRQPGASLVHVGPAAPPEWHALAHAINAALGAIGRTVRMIEPVTNAPADPVRSLSELVADIHDGKVDTLIILGGDPVYSAPGDLGFAAALRRVRSSFYLGYHRDRTAANCRWHVPQAHAFESWGDARAFDGTATIQQPQIRPLFNGRTALELLGLFLGQPDPDLRRLIREHWRDALAGTVGHDFDAAWTEALRRGTVPETTAATTEVSTPQAPSPKPDDGSAGLQALFRPDAAMWDGRFASNDWLQEMPRPLTRLTWDNAALIAPATARRFGLANGDVVDLRIESDSLRAPVWVLSGQAADCVTLPLGYGRQIDGRASHGFDTNRMRRSDALWHRSGITLTRTGEHHAFAPTQHFNTEAGRDLVRTVIVGETIANPTDKALPSLYPERQAGDYAWGMSIDTSACIGCGACVIACQAENNVPVVGKAEVMRGRAMHWLRIDCYEIGPEDDPDTAFQPMLCMHCENAPCEVACPVQATVHDREGLNAMVYNRCIGTRFCSNNCPYKVRRFNFFGYAASEERPSESRNPDVTVRARGVMEKCTYCVQRISAARIAADREGRPIRDGEVITACQAACPTQAIVFGATRDPDSAVSRRKASPLDYALLAELNTRPRTSYLARVRNPNPEIKSG
jgi:molybdopterin-containing oxidoreductase family iron-sulfur binding subunit